MIASSIFRRFLLGFIAFCLAGSAGLMAQDSLLFRLVDASTFQVVDEPASFDLYFDGERLPDDRAAVRYEGGGHYMLRKQPDTRIERVQITVEGLPQDPLSWEDFRKLVPSVPVSAHLSELDEVVLITDRTGSRKRDLSQTVHVIHRRDVQLWNSQTTADMLQRSGEVFVQRSQQGGGSPNLRGFEANKVLLVIDGLRMNNAIYRGGHLQNAITVDPNILERTEVLFGPAGIMYGSDALGGVMAFRTMEPRFGTREELEVKGNAMLRWSSANREKSGHVDWMIGGSRLASLTSLTVSDYGDLRSGRRHPAAYPLFGLDTTYVDRIGGRDTTLVNPNPHLQLQSGYGQLDLLQKFRLQSKSGKLLQGLNLQYSTSTDVPRYDRLSEVSNGELRFADWHYGPQQRLLASYQADWFRKRAWMDHAKLLVAYQDIRESRINRRFGSDQEGNRQEQVNVLSLNLDVRKNGKTEGAVTHYGLDLSQNWVQSNAFRRNIVTGELSDLDTRYPDGGSVMSLLGGYWYQRRPIFRRALVLSYGARLNQVFLRSRFDDKQFFPFLQDEVRQQSLAPSGSLGLVYAPENWQFRLNLASGFRAPNVDDVGKTFDSSPGNVIVPNPGLQPEYTYTAELGVLRSWEKTFTIEAQGFYTLYQNALVVRDFSLAGQDSVLYDGVLSRVQAITNTGEARIYGGRIEFNLRLPLGLRLDQTLTYIQGQDVSADVPLDHIPPLFGRTSLRCQQGRLQAALFAEYNGWKRIEDYSPSGEDNQKFATADGMPAWMTLNLKTSYAIGKKYWLQFGVDNLLDRHYRVFASGISAPGRNFILALRASF